MSALEVVEYGAQLNGARRLAVQVSDGVRVLVEPSTERENAAAATVAARIADQVSAESATLTKIAALENALRSAEGRVARAEMAVRDAKAVLDAALSGRRRFFSAVLMKPVAGDWSGEVWLMDPTKRERGICLRFKSVAEVHELHPELWVVSVSAEGVLLDAWSHEHHDGACLGAVKHAGEVTCTVCRARIVRGETAR